MESTIEQKGNFFLKIFDVFFFFWLEQNFYDCSEVLELIFKTFIIHLMVRPSFLMEQ